MFSQTYLILTATILNTVFEISEYNIRGTKEWWERKEDGDHC